MRKHDYRRPFASDQDKGLGTRQISQEPGRSIKTVETYRARIKEKLALTSTTILTREVVRWVKSRR